MARSGTVDQATDSARYDDIGTLGSLLFALLAPPLAWAIHLVSNYAFSSNACYPGRSPRNAPLPGFDWLWGLLIAVDLTSMVICVAAALVALRSWPANSEEIRQTASPLLELGEDRTRFLAIWGVIIGSGFFIAVLFDFVGLWVLPICG
jgi:hypothetical protein